MSSPPRRLSQDWNTIWDRREGDEYEERPMVGMGGDSSHRYGRGNGDGSKATGCGRLEISTSAEFLPSPSPSPSPLSSPLSRSSSLAFPWGAMGGLTSVTEEAGSVAEGFGFMATATAAAAEAGTAQPQRVHRPNPLLRGRDAVAKRRRDMFLNKVRLGRDERRWGDRGEQVCNIHCSFALLFSFSILLCFCAMLIVARQILRLDFVADKKRWEAELARTAPEVVPEAEYDDEVDMGGQGDVHPKYGNNDLYRHHQAGPSRHYQRPSDYGISHSHDSTRSASPFHQKSCEEQEREEAELIAQRERQELEALVALMEDEQHQPLQQVPQLGSQQGQVIGNDIDVDDDEALDGLLMGYASSKEIGGAMARGQDQGQEWDQYPDQGHTQCDEMDMSMG